MKDDIVENLLFDLGTQYNSNKKINSYVHKFHIRMKSLNSLEKDVRKYFMQLCLENTNKNIDIKFEGKINSFLKNHIKKIYRNYLKLI